MDHPSETPRPKRKGRNARFVLVFTLVPILVLAIGWFVVHGMSRGNLGGAIAEADRLDPGWRVFDASAKRTKIPDSENSALLVEAIATALPKNWPSIAPNQPHSAAILELLTLSKLDPAVTLDSNTSDALREELEGLKPPLRQLEALANAPRGRYEFVPVPLAINSAMQRGGAARTVARLALLQAFRRAQDGDADGALESCRAIINAGRSFGDEGMLLTLLQRCAIDATACGAMQRVLAQGEASDASLSELQNLLVAEANEPNLLHALRGERASSFEIFDRLSLGDVPISALGGGPAAPPSPGSKLIAALSAPYLRHNQSLTLSLLNGAVEIAKLPVEKQPERWKQWKAESQTPTGNAKKAFGGLALTLGAAVVPSTDAFLRNQASLRSAIVLVAVERFRLANGHWPDSIDELMPSILKQAIIDPYSGKPIRIVREHDTISIYSVGPDGQDNGGVLNPRAVPGSDVGYRLWDIGSRRRSPDVAGELPQNVFQSPAP
jgi:hypothetical protein